MSNVLDRVRKNKQNESTTSNSKKGLLETVRERRKKEYERQSADLRMKVVADKYNKSLEDLRNVNTSGYSNQNDYVNRIAKANSIKREANDLKNYVNSFGTEEEKRNANSYLSGISLNIDNQNRFRNSLGEYMTQWKDEEDYNNYLKAKARYEELIAEGYEPSKNYGESALSSGISGAYDAVVNSTNAFLDMALGKPMRALENSAFGEYLGMDLPGEQIGKLYEYSQKDVEKNNKQREIDNFKYNSELEQFGLDASGALGSAIPMAAMTFMSGGLGAGAGAAVGASTTTSQMAANYIKQLAKDPKFWSSVVTSAGSTYDSALDEGASYEEALTAALMNAPISGAIEVGSGLETQIGAKNTLGNWLKSALEEGGEEAVQGIVENFAKKAAYDTDRAVYSMEDANAIINPLRSAKEFGLGALAGGVLSGAGVGVNAAYETYARNVNYDNIGKYLINHGQIENVVMEAEQFDVNSDVYKLGQKVKTQVENGNVNAIEVGKLYSDITSFNAVDDVDVKSVEYDETVSDNTETHKANNAPVVAQDGENGAIYTNRSTSLSSIENDVNGAISESRPDGVVKSSGEDINIQRMEIVDDKVNLITSSGKTVALKDVSLNDELDTVITFAKKYTPTTANTMLHAYKVYSGRTDSQSALFFSRCWNQMYKYGLSGTKTFEDAMDYVIKDMPRTVYEMAYNRGQQDHMVEVEAKQKIADSKKTGIKKEGTVSSISEADAKKYKVNTIDMDTLSDKQKDSVAVMDVISKALGINTYFYSDEGAGKIHGIYKNGNMYLNINAGHFHEQAILRTAAHELTHHIQNVSPKLYEELKNFIVSKYYESNKKSFDALVQEKMDSLNLSMEKAIDEVIADACEMMLQDGSAVTELATKNKSLWENIKAFINSIIEKIRNAFKGVSESSAAAVELKKVLGDWTELQKMWNEALVESEVYDIEETDMIQFKKNRNANYYNSIIPATREESKTLNMLDDRNIARYRNEIDSVFQGTFSSGKEILIGTTSDVLKKSGIDSNCIYMSQSIARKIAYPEDYKIFGKHMGGKHNLGLSALKNLPLQIADPLLITNNTKKQREKSEKKSVVIWTNWVTSDGRGVLLSLVINANGAIGLQHNIATVFDPNEDYAKQFFEDEQDILYTRNNKDINELLSNRRHVPEAITDDVFIYRILQKEDDVNREINEFYSKDANSFSPRYILASTLMSTVTNSEEYASLKKYQDAIASIEDKETRLAITKNAIRTAIFEREAGITGSQYNITKLKESARALERSVDYWDKKLLELEATAPLKNLMERQRKHLSEKYMNEARTRLDETRARFYASNRREQIKKNANSLISWLERPDNNHYVPDVMKKPVLEFLNCIDFVSSKASPTSNTTVEWVAKMEQLENVLKDMEIYGDGNNDSRTEAFLDAIDPELMSNIKEFINSNQGKAKLSDLDAVDVEKIHRIIVALKSAVTNANKFYANQMASNVAQVGQKTMDELRKYKDKNNGKLLETADGLLNVDMLDARSYFNMMGDSGLSIYNELRDGFNKRVSSLKEAQEYMEKNLLSDKTEKERKALLKEWTGSHAKVHEFKFKDYLKNDVTVTLTTGQLMNLYCLSKRLQAMGHITVGGIRIKPAENKKVKGNVVGVHISENLLNSWLMELTPEQRQTADMMQKYLSSVVSDWGNEVSQAMYGYDKFTEKYYWPIETDNNTNKTSDRTDGGTSLYNIKNMGMTKAVTPRANNPLMVGDIFDVFTKHVADMANYRGYVIPLLDAMKWYNYGNTVELNDGDNSYTEFDSVKQQIERALGKKSKQYFVKLMQDINGGDTMDKSISEKFVSGYKSAAVGGNLRVAIQQPTAYVRAAAVMDPKYLVKALGHMPAIAEMQEHSGVAQWKSWGYFDTGIGQSLKKIISGQSSFLENVRDKSMWLTGKADDITWGTIWNACKEEVKDTNPDSVDTAEFMKLVTKRFDEVIDRTQVVDTVLHRTQIMRSKNAFNQMATSFMSEPSKSYNLLRNAIVEMALNKDKASALNAARTLSVWLISSFCTAAASAIVDAMRSAGDDEDKNAWERYIEALKENAVDNINPLNMIPYLKEIPSLIEGYSPARMDMEAISSTVKFAQAMKKLISGDNTKYNAYYYVRLFARAGSQLSGIPIYNAMRDFEGLWNSVSTGPKITTKKSKEKETKVGSKDGAYAYMSGELGDAQSYLEEYKEHIAEEYPAYSSDKVHQIAVSRIKSSITSEYKEKYACGSDSEKKDIISMMKATGLYEEDEVEDVCQDWEVSYWKNLYLTASSGDDRAEYRRKLYATGKWKSLSKLDADIRKWTN